MLGLFLHPIFPSCFFFILSFFPLTIILGSFEHNCDLGRVRWCPPPFSHLPKQQMLEAGAVGVVLMESALGPERGCSSQREAICKSYQTSKPGAQRRAMLQLLAAFPVSRGGQVDVPRQKAGGFSPPGEGRSHGGSNPILPEAERSPLLPFSPRISTDK